MTASEIRLIKEGFGIGYGYETESYLTMGEILRNVYVVGSLTASSLHLTILEMMVLNIDLP